MENQPINNSISILKQIKSERKINIESLFYFLNTTKRKIQNCIIKIILENFTTKKQKQKTIKIQILYKISVLFLCFIFRLKVTFFPFSLWRKMQSILVRSSHLKGSRLLNNSIFKNQSSTTLNKINIQNLQISRFFGNELKFKNNITKKNDLMNQNEQFNSFKKTNNNQSTTLFFKHASNRSFLSNFKQQSQSIIFNNNDFKYFSCKL